MSLTKIDFCRPSCVLFLSLLLLPNHACLACITKKVLEEFVTSSGTTDGFETYDFDYFTNIVIISPVFASTGETISISEVSVEASKTILKEMYLLPQVQLELNK